MTFWKNSPTYVFFSFIRWLLFTYGGSPKSTAAVNVGCQTAIAAAIAISFLILSNAQLQRSSAQNIALTFLQAPFIRDEKRVLP